MTVEELNNILNTAYDAKFVLAGDASHWTCTDYEIIKFAAMIAAAEREACAKVCEDIPLPKDAPALTHLPTIERCADAIRARGESK
jgi:hypothetical protein